MTDLSTPLPNIKQDPKRTRQQIEAWEDEYWERERARQEYEYEMECQQYMDDLDAS